MRALAGLFVGCLAVPIVIGAEGPRNLGFPAESRPSVPQIAVKRMEARRGAYAEHVGPYWTIGPRFARLREYMDEHNQPGPMFARFLDDPITVPADSLRSELGFFITEEFNPEPPHRIAVREPELVAYVFVDTPFATPLRHLPMMREWIREHGYVAVGPVTEVYLVEKKGKARSRGTELRIAIQRVDSETSHNTKDTAVPPAERSNQLTPVLPTLPYAPRDDRGTVSGETHWSTGNGNTPAASEKGNPELLVTAAAEHPGRVTADSLSPAGQTGEQPRFDHLARQLLPDNQPMQQSVQVWLGQVVFRVRAAAKGIKRVYPGQEQAVMALADAVKRRYQVVSADFAVDPLDHAVVQVNPESDRHAIEKRNIMRDLDSLLGRIAVKGVDPEATLNELADIVRRAHEVLQTE